MLIRSNENQKPRKAWKKVVSIDFSSETDVILNVKSVIR